MPKFRFKPEDFAELEIRDKEGYQLSLNSERDCIAISNKANHFLEKHEKTLPRVFGRKIQIYLNENDITTTDIWSWTIEKDVCGRKDTEQALLYAIEPKEKDINDE